MKNRLRWSLRTQVIVVLFVGHLFVIWHRREPWVFAGRFEIPTSDTLPGEPISPDGTRRLRIVQTTKILILDKKSLSVEEALAFVQFERTRLYHPSFEDDNTITAKTGRPSDIMTYLSGSISFLRFTRRFPEWWWGHFYRPEVWLLPLSLGLLGWTFRKDRAMNGS